MNVKLLTALRISASIIRTGQLPLRIILTTPRIGSIQEAIAYNMSKPFTPKDVEEN